MSKRIAAVVAASAAALVGFVPAAGAVASTPTPTQKACDRAPWEAKIQGRPDYHPGTVSGDYLWHDTNGFHLRVTHHRNDRAVFAGRIVSSAPMRKDAVRLEGRDYAALSANRKVLTFRFYNYGHTDGVNFHTDCARALSVRWLNRDGKPLAHSHINLGAASAHPAHVPFTVHRAS
jgi:hypothetical protein